ncbi:gamma-glutamylcyclotransferase family protein [Deinococcus sp.]|uniref:gamma-glutamylcyclotransferase family protein n=1 Tax=Deinococcus sp. TaxID=47478 RepID=UPI003C7EC21D
MTPPVPEAVSSPTSVFVYGTLMPGERYEAVARAAGTPEGQEPATLEGYALYHLHPEGYPALVAGGGRVRGWLLHYDPAVWLAALVRLDDLEGLHLHPPLYSRTLAAASTQAGESRLAWVYLYARTARLQHSGCLAVLSGDWTDVPGREAGVGWPGDDHAGEA